jgi:hypothetical protein
LGGTVVPTANPPNTFTDAALRFTVFEVSA